MAPDDGYSASASGALDLEDAYRAYHEPLVSFLSNRLPERTIAADIAHTVFASLAAEFYPPKRWIGEAPHGVLPAEALAPPAPRAPFAILPVAPPEHAVASAPPLETTALPVEASTPAMTSALGEPSRTTTPAV